MPALLCKRDTTYPVLKKQSLQLTNLWGVEMRVPTRMMQAGVEECSEQSTSRTPHPFSPRHFQAQWGALLQGVGEGHAQHLACKRLQLVELREEPRRRRGQRGRRHVQRAAQLRDVCRAHARHQAPVKVAAAPPRTPCRTPASSVSDGCYVSCAAIDVSSARRPTLPYPPHARRQLHVKAAATSPRPPCHTPVIATSGTCKVRRAAGRPACPARGAAAGRRRMHTRHQPHVDPLPCVTCRTSPTATPSGSRGCLQTSLVKECQNSNCWAAAGAASEVQHSTTTRRTASAVWLMCDGRTRIPYPNLPYLGVYDATAHDRAQR